MCVFSNLSWCRAPERWFSSWAASWSLCGRWPSLWEETPSLPPAQAAAIPDKTHTYKHNCYQVGRLMMLTHSNRAVYQGPKSFFVTEQTLAPSIEKGKVSNVMLYLYTLFLYTKVKYNNISLEEIVPHWNQNDIWTMLPQHMLVVRSLCMYWFIYS